MTPMLFSGAWEKMIHEKTKSKKSRDTVPLIGPRFKSQYRNIWVSSPGSGSKDHMINSWYKSAILDRDLQKYKQIFRKIVLTKSSDFARSIMFP
jgi:hypothetical protein